MNKPTHSTLAIAILLAGILNAGTALADTFFVTNNQDSGVGSLRQAILDVNANGEANEIIWAPIEDVFEIALQSPLPSISSALLLDFSRGYEPVRLVGHPVLTVAEGGRLQISSRFLDADIENHGILKFKELSGGDFANRISGPGTVDIESWAPLTLSGNNTYTGNTILSINLLNISHDHNLGAPSSRFIFAGEGETLRTLASINSGREIELRRSYFNSTFDTAGFDSRLAGPISGSGFLAFSGGGEVTLAGLNSYTGGIGAHESRIRLDRSGALSASGSVYLYTGGILDLNGYSQTTSSLGGVGDVHLTDADLTVHENYSFDGRIVGNGALIKEGDGTFTTTGENTYSGGTVINAGTLVTTSQSLPGNVVNNGKLAFQQFFDGVVEGDISGTGSVVVSAPNLILRGNNTYAGGTTLQGVLGIEKDENLGASSGRVTFSENYGSTLRLLGDVSFQRDFLMEGSYGTIDTQSFNGVINGRVDGVSLIKSGIGRLTLGGPTELAGVIDIQKGAVRLGSADVSTYGLFMADDATARFELAGFDQNISYLQGGGSAGGRIDLSDARLTLKNGRFSGSIIGSGGLHVENGYLELFGQNTYEGGTEVTNSQLFGTTESLPGDIKNNGMVRFDQDQDGEYAGDMSGTGSLEIFGYRGAQNGQYANLILSGHNTHSGGTIVSNGIASISSGENLGTADGSVTLFEATLSALDSFSLNNNFHIASKGTINTGSHDVELTGQIDGVGEFVKTGAGTLRLSGETTQSGSMTIEDGTLEIFSESNLVRTEHFTDRLSLNGGTLRLLGDVSFVGALEIAQAGGTLDTGDHTFTLTNYLWSNSGVLRKTGSGMLDVQEASGRINFQIDQGTLRGSASNFDGNITNNATVEFDESFDAFYYGDLNGSGRFIKTGAAGLAMIGDVEQSEIWIKEGLLQFNQDKSAARIGALRNDGALNLFPGVLKAGAYSGEGMIVSLFQGPSEFGRLEISGQADISKTTLVPFFGETFLPRAEDRYTVLNAGDLVGQFADLIVPAGFRGSLSYINGSAILALQEVRFMDSALNSRQRSVAAIVDSERENPVGDWVNVIGRLNTFDAAGLQDAFDQMGPSAISSLSGLSLVGVQSQSTSLRRRFEGLRKESGSGHFAVYDTRSKNPVLAVVADAGADLNGMRNYLSTGNINTVGFFGSLNGSFGRLGTIEVDDISQPGYGFSSNGVTLGADLKLNEATILGVSGGFQNGSADLDFDQGSSDVKSLQLGLYATHLMSKGAFINGFLGGSHNSYETRRGIPAFGRTATGSPDGVGMNAMMEAGVDRKWKKFIVSPSVGLEYAFLRVNSFDEDGAGALNLHVDEQNVDSLRSIVGARVNRELLWGSTRWSPSLRVGWEHEYMDDDQAIAAQFVTGSNTFSTPTATAGKDAAIVGAGVAVQFSSRISGLIDYKTEFGRDNFSSQTIDGTVRVTF